MAGPHSPSISIVEEENGSVWVGWGGGGGRVNVFTNMDFHIKAGSTSCIGGDNPNIIPGLSSKYPNWLIFFQVLGKVGWKEIPFQV